mgnify:CR=1 FL=1
MSAQRREGRPRARRFDVARSVGLRASARLRARAARRAASTTTALAAVAASLRQTPGIDSFLR